MATMTEVKAPTNIHCRPGFWHMYTGNYEVSVTKMRDGRWMSDVRLKSVLDSSGSSAKQEVFDDVNDALRAIGFPVGIVPIPEELN